MKIRSVAVFVLATLMASCGASSTEMESPPGKKDEPEVAAPPTLTSVEIGFDSMAVTRTGNGRQAWVRTDDQFGQHYDTTITWSSSDSTVAPIGSRGYMTALSNGTVTITARAGQLEASKALTVDIAEPADEERVWEAFCIIRDSFESYAPGLSGCIDARLWSWASDGGRDVVLEVRNLQGSLGGKYDTATRSFLTDIGLIAGGSAQIHSVTNVSVGTPGAVEKRGTPAWALESVTDKSVRFATGLLSPLSGCGRTGLYEPQSEYRTCIPEGVDGHVRIGFHFQVTGWSLEGTGLIVNLRMENQLGNTQVFCNGPNSKTCLDLTLAEVRAGGF